MERKGEAVFEAATAKKKKCCIMQCNLMEWHVWWNNDNDDEEDSFPAPRLFFPSMFFVCFNDE